MITLIAASPTTGDLIARDSRGTWWLSPPYQGHRPVFVEEVDLPRWIAELMLEREETPFGDHASLVGEMNRRLEAAGGPSAATRAHEAVRATLESADARTIGRYLDLVESDYLERRRAGDVRRILELIRSAAPAAKQDLATRERIVQLWERAQVQVNDFPAQRATWAQDLPPAVDRPTPRSRTA